MAKTLGLEEEGPAQESLGLEAKEGQRVTEAAAAAAAWEAEGWWWAEVEEGI